ncbi:MAG: GIY-YIG nuclease family protein [Patescibacteria group bacterium]
MVVASTATRRRGGDKVFRNKMWYSYVLRSKKNGRFYYGSTSDLKRRFLEHNQGIGGKYTRDNRPFELVYYEAYLNNKDAKKAEDFYKSGYGREVFKGKIENFLKDCPVV